MTIKSDLEQAFADHDDERVDDLLGLIKAGIPAEAEVEFYDDDDEDVAGEAYATYGTRGWQLEKVNDRWEIYGWDSVMVQHPDGTAEFLDEDKKA